MSYAELVKGETVAQRTIDRLDLDMDAEKLTERVTAKSKAGTVLIDVSVLDESPVRARDIANALSDEFVMMATELETPPGGTRPDARVIVEQRATIPEEPMVPRKGRNLALPSSSVECWALALPLFVTCSTTPSRAKRFWKGSPAPVPLATSPLIRNSLLFHRCRSIPTTHQRLRHSASSGLTYSSSKLIIRHA